MNADVLNEAAAFARKTKKQGLRSVLPAPESKTAEQEPTCHKAQEEKEELKALANLLIASAFTPRD